MKTNIVAVAGISVLVLFALAVASVFEIKLASAQVDATSSSSSTEATTTALDLQASTSSTPIADVASSTSVSDSADTTVATSSSSTSIPAVAPPPQGLTLVHIVGTKYTDYFTDGTTETAFPGDPKIDSNLAEPNAQIPTHEDMTWVHTTGGYLYDTPSGDLEVGDYAVQSNGTNIENAPPFLSSTSTAPTLQTSAVAGGSSSGTASAAVLGTATSTIPVSLDTSTTSADTGTPSSTTTSPNSPSAASANTDQSSATATTTGN